MFLPMRNVTNYFVSCISNVKEKLNDEEKQTMTNLIHTNTSWNQLNSYKHLMEPT